MKKLVKYQLYENYVMGKNAGSKAPLDVAHFAEEAGFFPLRAFFWGESRNLLHRVTGQFHRFFEYFVFFLRIRFGSVLFLQFPLVRGGIIWRKLFLESITKVKKVKIIILLHDLNELRNFDAEYQSKLIRFIIKISSVIIVHNERMAGYLENEGVQKEKLVCLEAFDYATSIPISQEFKFDKSICIAGNLSSEKCRYLARLSEIKNAEFNLFGVNYEGIQNEKIHYHGSFSPDGLPHRLSTGFGLIWDGDSIETCSGDYGNYLRYNNPHKFSLYIVAGLPVVAWKESALAPFIEKNRVGILVENLHEAAKKISEMGDDEYAHIKMNVMELAEKINSGYFTKRAIGEALERLHIS